MVCMSTKNLHVEPVLMNNVKNTGVPISMITKERQLKNEWLYVIS